MVKVQKFYSTGEEPALVELAEKLAAFAESFPAQIRSRGWMVIINRGSVHLSPDTYAAGYCLPVASFTQKHGSMVAYHQPRTEVKVFEAVCEAMSIPTRGGHLDFSA